MIAQKLPRKYYLSTKIIREKIEKVADAIRTHSYTKRLVPETLEGKFCRMQIG